MVDVKILIFRRVLGRMTLGNIFILMASLLVEHVSCGALFTFAIEIFIDRFEFCADCCSAIGCTLAHIVLVVHLIRVIMILIDILLVVDLAAVLKVSIAIAWLDHHMQILLIT